MSEEQTITAIEAGSKRGRVAVHVDGEQVLDLPKAYAEKSGLRVGQSLSPETQDEIRQASALQEAKVAAVKALGTRARTRSDLEQKLLRRGLPQRAVTQTLDWLADRQYLDDEKYAHQRWQSLSQRKLGGRAILQKLVQEGVPRAMAEQVMAAQDGALDETEQVLELARQRNENLKKLPWLQRRQRLYGYLARRGFAAEAISEALARLDLDEE
ncbi:MAG: regulatory protein RecX [Armatimonadota bacterium]